MDQNNRKRKFQDTDSIPKVHHRLSQVKNEIFSQYNKDVEEIAIAVSQPQTIVDDFDINNCFEPTQHIGMLERIEMKAMNALQQSDEFYRKENYNNVITEQPHHQQSVQLKPILLKPNIQSQKIKLLPPTHTMGASQPIRRLPLIELAQCHNNTSQPSRQIFSKFQTGQKVKINIPHNVTQSIKPPMQLLKTLQFPTTSTFNFCKFFFYYHL